MRRTIDLTAHPANVVTKAAIWNERTGLLSMGVIMSSQVSFMARGSVLSGKLLRSTDFDFSHQNTARVGREMELIRSEETPTTETLCQMCLRSV